MGTWALPVLETASLLLVGWCLADAWRRGARPLFELVAGGLFGLAVEQAAIWISGAAGRPDAYGYGSFSFMLTRNVPLVIAISWGALLYAAMKYSDSLGVPLWLRPFADGLYALMLDLTMAVAAVRLGFWHWSTPPEAQWFGAPYSNFGGWLLLAILFSAGVRLARLISARAPALVHALVLLVIGLAPPHPSRH